MTDSPADEPWLVCWRPPCRRRSRRLGGGATAPPPRNRHRRGAASPEPDRAGAQRRRRRGSARGWLDGAWPAVRSWRTLLVLEPLASGLSGDVHRAWDTQLDREVAVKFLHPLADGTAPSLREARALARVRHPNVVTVYGAEHDSGQSGLWMELIDGETLADAVHRARPDERARGGRRSASTSAAPCRRCTRTAWSIATSRPPT